MRIRIQESSHNADHVLNSLKEKQKRPFLNRKMEKISILFCRYLELKLQFCYYIYFQIVQTGFFELFSTFPTLLTCSPLEDVEDVQTRGLKVGGGIVGLGDEQLVLSAIIHRLKHVRHLASR